MKKPLLTVACSVALSGALVVPGVTAQAAPGDSVDTTSWDAAAEQLFTDSQLNGPTAVYVAVYKPDTGWTRRAMCESAPRVSEL